MSDTGGESRFQPGKTSSDSPAIHSSLRLPTSKVPGKHILLLARENGLDHPRLGLVIGKKNVKLAVERNRLKRLLRDSFRLNQQKLAGLDIVVIARKGLGDLENPELHQQFGKLWKRLLRNRPSPEPATESPGVADSSHA